MKVIEFGWGWMKIEGEPLPEFLDDCVIVDSEGNELGKLQGFVIMQGQTMKEAIEAALPEGCTLLYRPPMIH